MLLKPDKPVNLTTSYRPISLISSIMKLFKRVIEQRLRSHLEDIGFINKHQSGFRRAKSTDDHLFRLSQSIMESFNRGEHVVAAFLDVEKAFDNVWHNGLRYKIFQLGLPTKMTRWLSDFLVGRLIQVNVNSFLSNQINPKAGVPHGSVLSPLLFLIYVNDLPPPHHKQNSATLIQIYKEFVRPIFEYGSLSTITASDKIISKIQRLQNQFIRLALRLPKYIIPRLLHDSTVLPYVKDRLLTCATKSLDRIA